MSSVLPIYGGAGGPSNVTGSGGGMMGLPTIHSKADGVNYTGSVWGTPIPVSQGIRKITGVPLWTGQPKTTVLSTNPNITDNEHIHTSYSSSVIKRDFAVGFGYNLSGDQLPPQVRRVWADGTLIYSKGEAVPPVSYTAATNNYAFGEGVIGGNVLVNGKPIAPPESSNLTFRFYTGNEQQTADPAIVADKGDLAPAFRGMIYMVIEGLVVGSSTTWKNTFDLIGYEGPQPQAENSSLVKALELPKIEVELMDGQPSNAQAYDLEMQDDAVTISSTGVIECPDWANRRFLVVDPANDTISTFDMDSKAQLTHVAINGQPSGQSGFAANDSWLVWDPINEVLYSTFGVAGKSVASVSSVTGAFISEWGSRGLDLGPRDANGADPTVTGLPCVGVSRPFSGALSRYSTGGIAHPVLFNGYDSFQVLVPSEGGVLQTTIPALGMVNPDARDFHASVQAFDLIGAALKKGPADDQDCAFLYTYGSVVRIAYVTVRSGVQQIVGNVLVADLGTYVASAFLDADSNIVIVATKSGQTALVSKVAVTMEDNADFGTVSGWLGIFPKVGNYIYKDVPLTNWGGQATTIRHISQNSDVSKNTLFISGTGTNYVLNLTDGSVSTTPGLTSIGATGTLWDSAQSSWYFIGTQSSGFGSGARWALVNGGLGGSIGTLSNYLEMLAIDAGYSSGDLEIDSSLNDQIVGMLIVKPYDADTLFNALGVVYGFTYFNSGGKLRFAPITRNPAAASTVYTVTAAGPADGATVTLGGATYTYRDTPAFAYDVQRGATLDVSLSNLVNAINGTGTGFFAGTIANGSVSAVVKTTTTAQITARQGGTAGNSIVSTRTGTGHSFTGTTLAGGSVPPPADVELDIDDLMFVQSGLTDSDALITTISPPGGIAQASALTFYSLEQNYQLTEQRYIPDDQGGEAAAASVSVTTYDLPVVMSISEAYGRIARVALASTENEIAQEFQLSQKQLRLEPNDVVGITIAPYRYVVRIDEATYNADFSLSVTGFNYAFRNDVNINDVPSLGVIPQSVPGPADAVPIAVDGPILDPLMGTVAGRYTLYEGVRTYGQTGWLGSTLYLNGQPQFSTVIAIPAGTLTAVLPDTLTPDMTDESSITVTLRAADTASFATATADEFLQGKNLLIVGKPGSWEYIYFRDVTVLGAKSVELTGLIRGRRGTEVFTGTHTADDTALLVASVADGFTTPYRPKSYDVETVGATLVFTAAGEPMTRPPTTVSFEAQGQGLWPWAPAQLKAVGSGSDVNLSWLRRDRIGTTKFVTDTMQLSETSEKYDLEIMDGTNVVRTVSDLTSPAYTYLAADIVADGFTGPLTSIKIRVYQIGELDRGFKSERTINVE